MHREGEEIHVTTTEAKGGNRGSFVFQVLMISLVLVVAVMAGLWWYGSATAPSQGGAVTALPTAT